MSIDMTQAQKPADDLLQATRQACEHKLDRAYSPTTTIRARDAVRIMDAEYDVTEVGVALGWLEAEVSIVDREFSMTIEPNAGKKQRMRYRLAEAGDGDD